MFFRCCYRGFGIGVTLHLEVPATLISLHIKVGVLLYLPYLSSLLPFLFLLYSSACVLACVLACLFALLYHTFHCLFLRASRKVTVPSFLQKLVRVALETLNKRKYSYKPHSDIHGGYC